MCVPEISHATRPGMSLRSIVVVAVLMCLWSGCTAQGPVDGGSLSDGGSSLDGGMLWPVRDATNLSFDVSASVFSGTYGCTLSDGGIARYFEAYRLTRPQGVLTYSVCAGTFRQGQRQLSDPEVAAVDSSLGTVTKATGPSPCDGNSYWLAIDSPSGTVRWEAGSFCTNRVEDLSPIPGVTRVSQNLVSTFALMSGLAP